MFFNLDDEYLLNVSWKVKWKKPEIGWVKVNVDGSRDQYEAPTAGCGGVVRDAWGTWLIGFSQKLDPKNKPHQTELEAILKGLKLALKMNFDKVVVESDCESAVRMVESGLGYKFQRPEYEVVQSIKNLILDHEWQVEVVYVPRNANRLANKLAKDARELSSYEPCNYLSVPDNCKQLFLEDNGQV
uniref:Ribonuclease H protein At1g65750 family n=1 Tax=Cajanus cajan TaxID=3821 RepID=A0A151TRW2_CAJCA|nr:Putative ribonuclease H protein At1g65750 family [Cajanus cajan]